MHLTEAEDDIHTPLCKAVHPTMSTASTFASFSSNSETASMCPYATASISGVLGREKGDSKLLPVRTVLCS